MGDQAAWSRKLPVYIVIVPDIFGYYSEHKLLFGVAIFTTLGSTEQVLLKSRHVFKSQCETL